MAPEPPSPSASSVLLPFLGGRERRGSLASLTSTKGEINKDALSQALDDIHTSASRSEALTCFHDFDGNAPRAGPKELVSNGVTGLYDKLKRGLGGTPVKDKGRPKSSASKDSIETGSVLSNASRKPLGLRAKSPVPDTASVQSNTSLLPSPVLTSFTSNGSQLEAGPNDPRSEAHKKLTENAEAKSSHLADVKRDGVAEDSDGSDAQVQEPPTGAELGRARSAIQDDDHSAAATQALARVLSNHDVQVTDKSRARPSLQSSDLPENPVDDSDSDASSVRSTRQTGTRSPVPIDQSRKDPKRPEQEKPAEGGLQRPPLPRVGASHLPGFDPSRTNSTDNDSISSFQTGHSRRLEPSPNFNSGLQRKRERVKLPPDPIQSVHHVPSHLKRRVISKAFWMKDENARDCFYCGQAFSTFRRKHHCRTCGQIFDAKCTTLVPGRPFGQPGTIRLCKPCEAMIYGSDDDSTVFSDDMDEYPKSPMMRRSTPDDHDQIPGRMDGFADGSADVTTPSIGIPASRRNREAKRRSAVIEFDAAPTLARPTSSHSLMSLARRPRSSSHRRHHSRQQAFRGMRANADERGPFQPGSLEDRTKSTPLPAFHNDNIIDPDLAPFLSDEGSEDDEQPSIFAAMADVGSPSPGERERMGIGGVLSSAVKKGRSRLGTVSSGRGMTFEDAKHPRLQRNRHPSGGSMTMGRPSPRRSRSNVLLKPAAENDIDGRPLTPVNTSTPCHTKLISSSNLQGHKAPPLELNRASLEHARRLVVQSLKDNEIANFSAWEKALIPILLQCTDDVEPNVQYGDDMDIRHYIKLKKVPGGKPGDTSYVSGIVFSKNIALKSMARSISRPRIAIVTFAIEYARHHSHFMSLEPVIAQEQEYLRNLVGRIVALRPQVLLVHKHVSGSALGLLEQAGITVVYNIKESVLAAVARMTQTTMIKSVDKLAIDPSHLGQCESFEVKTYVHDRMRKSYIYLSGCPPDLGCTIVLRGADTKTLRRIKRITEFMCYVTYNLKLETSLMRDEFISIPSTGHDQIEAPDSVNGRRPPPQLEHGESEGTEDGRELPVHKVLSKYEHMEQECRARVLSASPFVRFNQPYLLSQLRDTERRLTTYKSLHDQYAAADEEGDEDEKHEEDEFSLVRPADVHAPASKDQPKSVREYLHAVHEAQLEKTRHTYETQKRLFESFMAGNEHPFDPFSHQNIVVLASTVSTIDQAPCSGPELIAIQFYAGARHVEPQFEEDCTLGQFVEDMCMAANTACKDCQKKVQDHHRQYVHGYGQLSISVQRQAAKMRGYHKTILMWATCRICRAETTVTPMSENTWKYSFAKYLELSFWSSPLHPRAGVCQHDIHKDFLRCFGFEDHVVRMQYDSVDIYDVVVPRPTITWKVESDLTMKNDQYTRFVQRLTAFTESIKKRLDSIHVDTLDEKKAEEAHGLLEELRSRADEDREELLRKLQQKYSESRYYELIPLNRALRFMDEKALAWDDTFNDFERDYFPSETDIRKLATLQLRNMFLESQPAPSVVNSDVSDNEEGTEMTSVRPKLQHHAHTALDLRSDEAHHVMTNTMEEHKDKIGEEDEKAAGPAEDTNSSTGEGLARKVSPREEQVQAVQRDDVKHLDLAIPVNSHESPIEEDESSGATSKRSSRPITSESTDEPFAIQKPMGSGLLERIEQIRHSRTPSGEHELVESKIPRLVDLKRRAPSPMPSPPPLIRAQSSPSPTHVPRLSNHSIDGVVVGEEPASPSPQPEPQQPAEKRFRERLGVDRLTNKMGRVAPSFIPRSIPKAEGAHSASVSALAKHFEQMSREFEKERLRERRQRITRSRQNRANPLASSQPVVEVYRNATEAVGGKIAEPAATDQSVEEQPVGEAQRRPASPQSTQPNSSDETQIEQQPQTLERKQHARALRLEQSKTDSDTDAEGYGSELDVAHPRTRDVSDPTSGATSTTMLSPTTVPEMELHPELSIPEHKKNVWFKYLAEFWSKRSASGWANLEYPLHATEHVFEDSDIIVREDEPSSVVALSLACTDYQTKSQQFRSQSKKPSKHHAHTNSAASNSFVEGDPQQNAIEASLLSDTGTHMKYSFAHGPVKASCKIFYAEAFDALRRRCGVADRFVESLSRCLKFDSKGGKTKSLFLKTLDNRFIIKSLQEVELKAFTKFAPDYFAFMSATLFHGVPSVIAKMFGLFQVTIKNPATGMDFSYYLLVMENLFYERNPNRRFDLKGSMRNRKIESTGQPDEVLLDENLVETIYQSPLFVREHARKLLQASVWNDTMFLYKQNVMDYSLMAGFDDERKELIVGIIDCIRTYTWDKKLESWIKDRGKNKPTITSPKDYRNRFRYSIMQYVRCQPHREMLRTGANENVRSCNARTRGTRSSRRSRCRRRSRRVWRRRRWSRRRMRPECEVECETGSQRGVGDGLFNDSMEFNV